MGAGQLVQSRPTGALWESRWLLLGRCRDSSKVVIVFFLHWGRRQEAEGK